MKAVSLLQIIYSFFLGLLVVALVAIGLNTFHPQPRWPREQMSDAQMQEFERLSQAWSLTASIVLLVCATVILAVSIIRPQRMAVISNGLLLGGVFTMIYAVGLSLGAQASVVRFIVAAAALVVTVGVGYMTFVRPGQSPLAGAAGRLVGEEEGIGAEEGVGDEGIREDGGGAEDGGGGLASRVRALERRLEALGRALNE